MNAISKRLLSWLCVIAMVLSLVPAVDLSGFAVETKAAEEIVYGSANLDGVDAAIVEQMTKGNAIDNSDAAIDAAIAAKTCPMCGATEVEWARKTGGFSFNDKVGETAHIYFDSAFETPGNVIQMVNYPSDNDIDSKDGTVCVALKSTAAVTATTYRIQVGGTNNVLNIMGTGKIIADQSKTQYSKNDLGLFQIAGETVVNLYGGEYTHVHAGTDFQKAVIRVTGAASVVNIFDGAKIGPAELDNTKVAQNVQYTAAGTVNMFGGEIRNGVAPAWGYSGNVTVTKGGKFNMYGGTISGGTFLDAAAVTSGVTMNANIGGNVMVGGKSDVDIGWYDTGKLNSDGTPKYDMNYTTSAGTFNMYGGTISSGKANNGGNGGGNICIYNTGASVTIMGGTVENGYAKAHGGNIQSCGGDLTIGGTALISGGEALSQGGSIQVNNANCALTISGGKIVGGKAANGGNVYVDKCQSVNISGGIFDGGEATNGNGGNLNVLTNAADKVTISGGTFLNGLASKQGGNINTTVALTISNATVANGTCRTGGGNINTGAQNFKLTLNDCTVYGGWVTGAWDEETQNYKPTGANWGGNVRTWVCDLEINGGLYHTGYRGPEKSAHQGNNVSCLSSLEKTSTKDLADVTLTIGGDAVIVGDVNTSAPSANAPAEGAEQLTCNGTSVVLKGAPKIVTSYALADGTTAKATSGGLALGSNSTGNAKADISALTADAQIVFTAPVDRVLSVASENAANVVGCFTMSNAEHVVAVNANNELYVTEKPIEIPDESDKPKAELGGQNLTDEVWAEVVKAAEIQAKAKNFELDAESKAECPVCGEVVEWKEAIYPGQTDNWTKSRHYYVNADTQVKPNYNWLTVSGAKKNEDGTDAAATITAEDVTVCLMLLNGDTAKEIGGMIGPRNSTKNVTFNIMGEGVITSNGTSTSDGQFGVVIAQGTENTVNLYGGTFIYTGDGEGRAKVDADGDGVSDKDANGKTIYVPNGTVSAAAINVKGSNNTVNMFNDVTVGPETLDRTKVNYNVRVEALAKSVNTLNMYGGTIRNGVTNSAAAGGNVHLHYIKDAQTAFNMYGGVIENGTYLEGTTAKTYGGNIFADSACKLSIYGGTVKDGSAVTNGGNIYADSSSISNVMLAGGTVTGGEAKSSGGNIYANAKMEIKEYALIENGYAGKTGGNIYLTGKRVATQSAGSEIRNGSCSGDGGGNLFVGAEYTYNMEGGKIYGGENVGTSNAGNILVQGGYDKETKVFTDAYFNMSGDAEVYGGIAPNQAGNVRGYIATITMTDNAKIYGGNGVKGIDDLWLVDGNLVMDGNATVESDEGGAAVSATVYRRNNTVTLKGNASVIGEYNALAINKNLHNDDKVTPLVVTLQIDNGWTGSANVTFKDFYAPAATVLAEDAICGTEVDGVFTKGGSFAGKLYLGSLAYCPLTGAEGALVLAANGVAKADGTGAWFATAAETLAAYEYGVDKYVVISEDATIDGDVVIDLAGQNITLSGKGTVYGVDSSNNTFESFGKITVAEGAQIECASHTYHPEANRRYVAVVNGNELSFHYLTISISDVTLRTENAGIYYKSKFKCDETLAAAIDGYGMVVSLNDMPGTDFMTEADLNLTTMVDGPIVLDEKGECVATSGSVVGIMKEERTAAENQQIAEMKIYSNAYVKVGENYILYKGGNPYVEPDPEKDVIAYSLKDVMVAIDDIWSDYEADQQATVKAFYETWKDLGMSAWASELENILA